jgi:hypothetical protein
MDSDRLVADAESDSVTSERLSGEVVDVLEANEQPHHLLVGSSLDYATGSTSERVYAAIDATATAVATDRRLLFVVPESVSTRVEALSYEAITTVDASFENPRELRVETPTATVQFYPSEGEDPTPVAAFLDGRVGRSGGGDGAVDVDLADAAVDADAGTVTSDGGRSAGGRPAAGADDAAGIDFRRGGDAGDGGDAGTAGPEANADDAGDDGRDPLDTLERLAALNEQGVIDDEEFARKKAELLDEI